MNPVTGYDEATQSSSISAGRAAAADVKRRWLVMLVEGQVNFATLVDYSKRETETRYLSGLRLYDILRERPGWTDATALDVLQRHGFTAADTVKTIRRHGRKIDLFSTLLKSNADRFRARPAPPEGWPWSGKLALLVRAAGEEVPDEIAALLDDDADETELVTEDAIAALLEDDDGDE